MSEQLDLVLPPSKADLDWLVGELKRLRTKDNRGWIKSRELGAVTEAQKRRLREVAEFGEGKVVSYPGSPGYKLLNDCSLEELRHGDRAVRSQIRGMAKKWKPIWRRMHALKLVED
jgi:hypothetical protein